MKSFPFMNAPAIYCEVNQTSLKALHGEAGIEVPLERQEHGRFTGPCREQVIRTLTDFAKRQGWQPRLRIYCAIGARGVSLRRLTLPPASKEELQRVLLLQIESEFPLPPDELAWGYRLLNSGGGKQEVLVAAVKKEVVEELAEVLAACGLNPVLTIAALARREACPRSPGSCAVLDLGRKHSEWITFEDAVPSAVRVISWGSQQWPTTEPADGNPDDATNQAAVEALAAAIPGKVTGGKLYLTGETGFSDNFLRRLGERLGGLSCERITNAGEGCSTAILGLKQAVEQGGGNALLTLQVKPVNGGGDMSRSAPTKWVKWAAGLAAAALLLPYAEAAIMKPILSWRIASLKAKQGTLDAIDREYDFLTQIRKNQSPYLDVLYLLTKCAQGGSKLDSVVMNRRGELSLRGSMRDGQQVADFRAKLIETGFFSTVVVEEQTPTPDRQKVNIRLVAQWKPAEARPAVKAEDAPKIGNRSSAPAGSLPPGAMPTGLPPGVLPPGAVVSESGPKPPPPAPTIRPPGPQ